MAAVAVPVPLPKVSELGALRRPQRVLEVEDALIPAEEYGDVGTLQEGGFPKMYGGVGILRAQEPVLGLECRRHLLAKVPGVEVVEAVVVAVEVGVVEAEAVVEEEAAVEEVVVVFDVSYVLLCVPLFSLAGAHLERSEKGEPVEGSLEQRKIQGLLKPGVPPRSPTSCRRKL